jgi:hypothetical protein
MDLETSKYNAAFVAKHNPDGMSDKRNYRTADRLWNVSSGNQARPQECA